MFVLGYSCLLYVCAWLLLFVICLCLVTLVCYMFVLGYSCLLSFSAATDKTVSMFSSDCFYRGLITGKLDFNATLSFAVFINRTYIKNSIVLLSEQMEF